MVNTVKFSQFAVASLTSSSTGIVGLQSGVNIQSLRYPVWTTATRPSPPFNGLMGVNTDLVQYEWYDAIDGHWVQFEDSGDISDLIARLAAHTVGDGASMIGLQNQSGVTSKTVQDLANATFIAKTDNGTLQNAQFLASLTTGIVKNTTVTGVLSISAPLTSIDGLTTVANQFLVTTAANTYGTLGALTNGQLIIGSTGAPPVVASLTAGSGVTITPGAGSITISATGLGGTVTSFSSGDLSPLFTTSVANPTTTPALSFTLTNASANTYFGNATGLSAAPSYTAAAALSKTDDTNVTLSLGGAPTVSLLAATSLTLGWTGQLSLARGGTNKNITAVAGTVVWCDADSFELTAAGSAGQLFQSTGTTSPAWTTATYPSTASTSGNVISSNGTNFLSSTLTSVMDTVFGNAQGDILYRNASGWVVLAPGTSGQFLQTLGAAANPAWASGNSGTVTSVATGAGLTGGTITATGTIALAAIADHTLLANISGGSLAPSSTTLTALIDNAIGSTQGNILYRNASSWVVLAPGTSGQFLQTLGAAANPVWAPGDGAGTVTSVTAGSGLTATPNPITSSGTIVLEVPIVQSSSASSVLINMTYTGGQTTTAGAQTKMTQDSGAAMVSGNVLGSYVFSGAYNASHNIGNGSFISGFATQNWTSTTLGSLLKFFTVPNGSATEALALTLGQDQTALFVGRITSPSIAFNTTSGIIGSTTNDNAAAGSVGEVISSNIVSGSAVSLTSTNDSNITSLSLTAGDWDVYGNVMVTGTGTTILNKLSVAISQTSATSPNASLRAVMAPVVTQIQINDLGMPAPTQRISLSAPATVYLIANPTFSASTLAGYGNFYARRAR